jgi:peptidoglycan/LPS O-acetylase OafA/YrhL
MMLPTETAPQRLAYVDCMRAIAALMVLVLHTGELGAQAFQSSAIDSWMLTPVFALDFGRAGVILFFAISGFVIPASLAHSADRIRFPIRRFFRLYPAYWLSILVSLIVGLYLNEPGRSASQVIANLSMVQIFIGYEDIEGLYWTLAVELVFYVICYALFLAGLIGRGSVLTVIALVLAAAWYFVFTATTGPFYGMHFLVPDFGSPRFAEWPAYFSIMFWSAACRQVVDRKASRQTVLAVVVLAIFWLTVLPLTGLAVYLAQRHDMAISKWALMKYGAFALGLYAFVGLTFLVRIRSPILRYIGAISFSIYLFHPPIMRLLVGVHTALLPALPVTPILFIAICAFATIVLSASVYRFVETPAIAMGNRIANRIVSQLKMREPLDRPRGA